MSLKIWRSSCPACDSKAIGKVMVCVDHTVTLEAFEIWECVDCTLRFTQNFPGQTDIEHYYDSETYISHSDTAKGFVNKVYKTARSYTLRWKKNEVNRFSNKRPALGSLLDIGAGTGAFLNFVARENWEVTGLEPDKGAREICKKKYGLDLQTPELLFEVSSQSFDVVTMWHVLEHVHQLHEYISTIKRILKADGAALVALPNYTSKDAQIYGSFWAGYDVPRHLYHFSPLAVAKLFAKHGLSIEAIRPMWLDAFYIAMLSEKYKKGNLMAALFNGLRSNLNAAGRNESCSSILYVLRNG